MNWVGLGMHNCRGFVDMWCRTSGKKTWVCNRRCLGPTGKPAESCRQDEENDKQVSWKLKDCMHIVKIFKELKKLSQDWKWRLKELYVFFMYCRGIVLWKYHLHWKRLNFCWRTQKINNISWVQFRVNCSPTVYLVSSYLENNVGNLTLPWIFHGISFYNLIQ